MNDKEFHFLLIVINCHTCTRHRERLDRVDEYLLFLDNILREKINGTEELQMLLGENLHLAGDWLKVLIE